MSLYQIRSRNGDFDVIKFDEDLNHQNTYQLSYSKSRIVCNCPAGYGKTCRHRNMLPVFELERAVDSGRFYDYENKKWMDRLDT